MENEEFKVRPMKKWELAQMYKPNITRVAAVHSLRRWINDCPELRRELNAADYNPRSKDLTSIQVELIVQYLGRP
jgi:hypothetical protein